ncbi:MAG: hypothetical protein IPM29_27125 [Planctomycetes bacterium]|nr:hypothetical protein [Planctomycetota bacterium]
MQTKRPGRGAVEDLIVVAVPAACKSMVGSIEALCAAVASRAASGAAGREAIDYAVSEVMVAELTGAVERDAHAVSRASFERVPHELGALYLRHQVNIEDAIVSSLEIPAEARAISVSLDPASVPMEEPIPRPPGRPRRNAPKITRVFHMAYCGTVTLHDGNGRALYSMRFGQMPGIDPLDVCNAMANVVYRLREKQPELRLQLLADGAHEMWNLLESSFPESLLGPRHLMVDFWHVLEKLSAAAEAIQGAESRAVVAGWRRLLERRKDAVTQILADLEPHWCDPVDGSVVKHGPIHEAITYLTNHAHRMNYAGARAKGLPIGSGTVEATCKSLIGVRMKRAGSRWKQDTGDHVIKLRALALSHQWDAAMSRFFATQRTAVRALAA